MCLGVVAWAFLSFGESLPPQASHSDDAFFASLVDAAFASLVVDGCSSVPAAFRLCVGALALATGRVGARACVATCAAVLEARARGRARGLAATLAAARVAGGAAGATVAIVARLVEAFVDATVAVVIDVVAHFGGAGMDGRVAIVAVGAEAVRADAVAVAVSVDATRTLATRGQTLAERRAHAGIDGDASVGEALGGGRKGHVATLVVRRAHAGRRAVFRAVRRAAKIGAAVRLIVTFIAGAAADAVDVHDGCAEVDDAVALQHVGLADVVGWAIAAAEAGADPATRCFEAHLALAVAVAVAAFAEAAPSQARVAPIGRPRVYPAVPQAAIWRPAVFYAAIRETAIHRAAVGRGRARGHTSVLPTDLSARALGV